MGLSLYVAHVFVLYLPKSNVYAANEFQHHKITDSGVIPFQAIAFPSLKNQIYVRWNVRGLLYPLWDGKTRR